MPQRSSSYWQALVRGVDGEPDRIVLVDTTEHPDGVRLELSAAEAAGILEPVIVATAVIRQGLVTELLIGSGFAPKAPPLWFVEAPEPEAQPQATNLMAFAAPVPTTSGGPGTGTLVRADALNDMALTGVDQVGAVRWYPASGMIDQIYVAPDRRRQHVATALLAAAGTLSVTRDWPRLWTDGERTALGEELRNARPWADRAADLTHLAPPMTPGEHVRR